MPGKIPNDDMLVGSRFIAILTLATTAPSLFSHHYYIIHCFEADAVQ